MCPAVTRAGNARGWIIPVGGGEKKVKSSTILQRFVELCGGPDAKMVIIPTGSELDTAGDRIKGVFRELGVSDIEIVDLATRAECENEEHLRRLGDATGIFFTGGNHCHNLSTDF